MFVKILYFFAFSLVIIGMGGLAGAAELGLDGTSYLASTVVMVTGILCGYIGAKEDGAIR